MNRCVVAVDVGNSAVKLCAKVPHDVDGAAIDADGSTIDADGLRDHAIRINQPRWESSVIQWVGQQMKCRSTEWRIASVHRGAVDRLQQAIVASAAADSLIFHVRHHDVPMRARIEHPDRLGIDRLVSAHGAQCRFGGPLVVVDAGSAVTVDWVDTEGDFCGGAILPGVFMQLTSLATGTDALPKIDFTEGGVPQAPGRNTSEAIRLGVTTGISATIDRLASIYSQRAGVDESEVSVVLTGGDAPLLSPLLAHTHVVVKNLVCRGLLDLPRSEQAGTKISSSHRD